MFKQPDQIADSFPSIVSHPNAQHDDALKARPRLLWSDVDTQGHAGADRLVKVEHPFDVPGYLQRVPNLLESLLWRRIGVRAGSQWCPDRAAQYRERFSIHRVGDHNEALRQQINTGRARPRCPTSIHAFQVFQFDDRHFDYRSSASEGRFGALVEIVWLVILLRVASLIGTYGTFKRCIGALQRTDVFRPSPSLFPVSDNRRRQLPRGDNDQVYIGAI